MEQGRIRIRAAAGHGDAVHKHIAANAWTDEQTGSVLPGKIQMLGTDARTGNHQITGAKRTKDTFPGNREPGIRRKFIAAGQNDQFSNRSGAGQVFKPIFTLFAVSMMPGEGKEQKHQGKKGKKPVGDKKDGVIRFLAHAGLLSESIQNSEFILQDYISVKRLLQ